MVSRNDNTVATHQSRGVAEPVWRARVETRCRWISARMTSSGLSGAESSGLELYPTPTIGANGAVLTAGSEAGAGVTAAARVAGAAADWEARDAFDLERFGMGEGASL
jgi:hypothetical protein